MQQSVPEFEDLLKALESESVRYVVIGGLAMVLQGASYVTFDLDIAIAREEPNFEAVIRALAPLNPFPPEFGSAKFFVWDMRSMVGAVVSLVTDAGELDILLVTPGSESYESLAEHSEVRRIGALEVNVASIDDLIAMKRAANRPKDIAHIAQLETLKHLREQI